MNLLIPFIFVICAVLSYEDYNLLLNKDEQTGIQLDYIFSQIYLGKLTTTAAIYMVTSLQDKANGLRHLMNFGGVKPLSYYSATIIADYVIFMGENLVFLIFVVIFNVGYLNKHIW